MDAQPHASARKTHAIRRMAQLYARARETI